MQRLIINKIYITDPQKLPREMKELDQAITAKADQLKIARANLIDFEKKKTQCEAHKAHLEIKQLADVEIPALESSIIEVKKHKQKSMAMLDEKNPILDKMRDELEDIRCTPENFSAILNDYDHYATMFNEAGNKIKALKEEIESLSKRLEKVPLLLAMNSDGSTVEVLPEYVQDAIDRLPEFNKELAAANELAERVAPIVKSKKGPYRFKGEELTIDDMRARLKPLKEQEEAYQAKMGPLEYEVYGLRSQIEVFDKKIEEQQKSLNQKKEEIETLTKQYGLPANEELKAENFDAQISSLNERIATTKNEIKCLEVPIQEQQKMQSLFEKLHANPIYNQLLNNPIALLRQLSQEAKNYFERHNQREYKYIGAQLRFAEFQRSIDEISCEEDAQTLVSAQEKCFQLCGLMNYTQGSSSVYGLDEDDCNEAYKNFLKKLNPLNPHYLSAANLDQINQALYDEARMNFHETLKPFSPLIDQFKDAEKFHNQIKALETIGTTPGADLEFCARVLRTATLRIKHPEKQEYASTLDAFAMHIKNEQPNKALATCGKVIAIVGAVICLAAIVVVAASVLAMIAPAASILVPIGLCGVGLGLFCLGSGAAVYRYNRAKGATKKILKANHAMTECNRFNFFSKDKSSLSASQGNEATPLLSMALSSH